MHLGYGHTLSGSYSESGSGAFIYEDSGDSDAYKNVIGYICTGIVIVGIGYWFMTMFKRDCKEHKMTELQYDTEPFDEENPTTDSSEKEVPVVSNSKNTEI